ncbi:hypothetical protein MTO96_018801 [Rhipicephalus appendiculatus]
MVETFSLSKCSNEAVDVSTNWLPSAQSSPPTAVVEAVVTPWVVITFEAIKTTHAHSSNTTHEAAVLDASRFVKYFERQNAEKLQALPR